MLLFFPVLDARVLDDLPATSLGRIEGHFQVSNELIMLSLESSPISPVRRPAVLLHTQRLLEQICCLPINVVISFDQFVFLAFRFHPNLLPHDQLRPEVTLPRPQPPV